MEYRKKPVVIEAFMYGIEPRPDWFNDKVTSNEIITYGGTDIRDSSQYYCEIKTLEGVMRGNCRDYIIKGVQGEVYPCKPDIFEMTYELASKSSQTEISDEEIEKAGNNYWIREEEKKVFRMRLMEFLSVSGYRIKEFFLYTICGIEFYRNYSRFYLGNVNREQLKKK